MYTPPTRKFTLWLTEWLIWIFPTHMKLYTKNLFESLDRRLFIRWKFCKPFKWLGIIILSLYMTASKEHRHEKSKAAEEGRIKRKGWNIDKMTFLNTLKFTIRIRFFGLFRHIFTTDNDITSDNDKTLHLTQTCFFPQH
jgi:hypothetical protein